MFFPKWRPFLLVLVFSKSFISFSHQDSIKCATEFNFINKTIDNQYVMSGRLAFDQRFRQWQENNIQNRNSSISSLITIPVVVHVIYNTATENISDAQIQSQIDILNKDFRNLNTDKLASTHAFYNLSGDAGIEFCLAKEDPIGNAVSGITRTYTSLQEFGNESNMKYAALGGVDAWDTKRYLNIWVCNLGKQLLGFATYPTAFEYAPNEDGVVLNFTAFGIMGTAKAPYNNGRTATHEIGHWLSLRHIWGDDNNSCDDDDGIDDTPNQFGATAGCPSGVLVDGCTVSSTGVMYQNYMDYSDDACLVMFTKQQIAKMRFVFDEIRTEMLSSPICSRTTSIANQVHSKVNIYPNPIQNYLSIEGLPKTRNKMYSVELFNMIGELVFSTSIPADDTLIEMTELPIGTYVLKIYNNDFTTIHKVTVVK